MYISLFARTRLRIISIGSERLFCTLVVLVVIDGCLKIHLGLICRIFLACVCMCIAFVAILQTNFSCINQKSTLSQNNRLSVLFYFSSLLKLYTLLRCHYSLITYCYISHTILKINSSVRKIIFILSFSI